MRVTQQMDPPEDREAAPLQTQDERVLLDTERATPLSIGTCEQLVVTDCAERVAMLARHRWTRPLSLRGSRERRIADQLCAIGTIPDAVERLRAWATATSDPWSWWAATYLLARSGAVWEGLPTVQTWSAARVVAEAAFLADVDARALAPGAALECRSLAGDVDDEGIARALSSKVDLEIAGAARATSRVQASAREALTPLLVVHLKTSDEDVFFEVARTLALGGRDDGLRILTGHRELALALGARALELFVMSGRRDDLDHIGEILRARRVTGRDLDALARFGHPEAWAFIAHFLSDGDLAASAEQALCTLFGAVDPSLPRSRETWKHIIASLDLDTEVRIRSGRRWSASAAATDLLERDPSAHDVGRRLDELRARGRSALADAPVPALWAHEPQCHEAIQAMSDWIQRVRRNTNMEDTWATTPTT